MSVALSVKLADSYNVDMNIRLARTDTFEHTISGLLKKRADLFGEAERLRDRMAEIKNDIHALDRVLQSLGYDGDLDAAMPRQKRDVIFGRGELTRAILSELRDSDHALSSREIAQSIIALRGEDPRDRKYLSDLVKRVSKALRQQRENGNVRSLKDEHGNIVWDRKARRTIVDG
ncbi:MAG: hypothetical protein WA980_04365 [Shinella zoogloeoides]|uniref:hypothetical protein n=1 Tax=Shinella zoogloeoides TaxID=352475 RepID=UPI003C756444